MTPLALLNDILFVGLGLLGPELPQMVEAAGRMSGQQTVVETRTAPEGPLGYHWLNAAAGPGIDPRLALASGRIDQVVMTEALPLADSLRRHRSVDYASRFRDLALRANPDAQTYLYESWPALTAVGPQPWRDAVAEAAPLWQAFVAAVNKDGRKPGDAPPMRLIPLAQGLLALSDAITAGEVPGLDDLSQLFSDNRQLNGRGTYFAAMLMHASLSGEDPTGLPVWLGRNRPASLDEAVTAPMAEAMQRIALRVSGQATGPRDAAQRRQAELLVNATVSDAAQRPLWQDPEASYLGGVNQPGIAYNLSSVNDWSVEQPFLDVFKTARPWIGHLPGQWGGFDAPLLREAGYLDAEGWPLRMPGEVTHLSTLILSGLDARMISVAGRYVLRYQGSGRIEIEGRARNISYEPGRISFDYAPGPGSVMIHLRATDPGDPVRRISVVRQDRLPLADAGQIFNPDFLARLRGAEVLRFMGWMRTNNATLRTVADLPSVDDYVWSTDRGVPPEVMVALANELELDPWFTLPHLGDDELMRSYARRVRDRLDSGRRAWVEFSNEVWNWAFDQRAWADEQALALWGVEGAGMQYGAWRAAQVADIWAEEFAPSAAGRLVRVIGTFTGATGSEQDMLMAPAWKAADPESWEPLAESFDAYAITGYFYANLEDPGRMAMLRDALKASRERAEAQARQRGLSGAGRDSYVSAHRFDQAIEQAITELRAGALSGKPEGTVQWTISQLFPYHRRAAAQLGLELVMYEGGSHVVASGPAMNDAELTEFLVALNYAPGMGDLYRRLLAGWRKVSDQPFNFYTAIDTPGEYGSWGVLRFLDDQNPRWDAVAEPQK
ncbi:hypothetical protein [Paracoccus spongiarum]|uniref:Uncharacterized protein n=1 Tax=Paracoccus spongiarum TaxID=3064387 RepID=A0ABT9J869_9RHOB|nr:hypothetical protein [Paracoccus sp. 2205BS29-5]MDP5305993.1 hypothetical protein [Paracoccus sp. 2205BS29-5]